MATDVAYPEHVEGGFHLLYYRDRGGWHAKTWIKGDTLPEQDVLDRAFARFGFGSAERLWQRWLRIFYNPKATVTEYVSGRTASGGIRGPWGKCWLVVSMEGDTPSAAAITEWWVRA